MSVGFGQLVDVGVYAVGLLIIINFCYSKSERSELNEVNFRKAEVPKGHETIYVLIIKNYTN